MIAAAPLSQRSSAIDAEPMLHEQLGLITLNANMAQMYIEAGDPAGFRYALASLVARVRAVTGIVNDLGALADEKRSAE